MYCVSCLKIICLPNEKLLLVLNKLVWSMFSFSLVCVFQITMLADSPLEWNIVRISIVPLIKHYFLSPLLARSLSRSLLLHPLGLSLVHLHQQYSCVFHWFLHLLWFDCISSHKLSESNLLPPSYRAWTKHLFIRDERNVHRDRQNLNHKYAVWV